jgi:hypothetical protein
MAVVVGDRLDKRDQVVAVDRTGSMMMRPSSSRTSTGWPSESRAAAMTEDGMRTAALLPHLLTTTRMMASACLWDAQTGGRTGRVNNVDTAASIRATEGSRRAPARHCDPYRIPHPIP